MSLNVSNSISRPVFTGDALRLVSNLNPEYGSLDIQGTDNTGMGFTVNRAGEINVYWEGEWVRKI